MSDLADLRLAAVEARLSALEARLSGVNVTPSNVGSKPSVGQGAIADDYDLDSEWGDEQIRKDPPRWKGASFAGSKMSQCPSDYLRELASFFDWKAKKDAEQGTYVNKEGKTVETKPQYAQKSAARARGWAKRNEGLSTAAADSADDVNDAGDIPF